MINNQEKRNKEYLKLIQRRNELYEMRRNSPRVEYDKPIQNGWRVYIRLKSDIFKRDEEKRNNMAEAVKICSHDTTIYKSDVVKAIRKTKSFFEARKIFTKYLLISNTITSVYTGPDISTIDEKKFEKLKPSVAKYFYKSISEHTSRWGGQKYTTVKYHLSLPYHYFEMRVSKNMIKYGKRDIDPKIEKEIEEIDQIIRQRYFDIYTIGNRKYRDRYYKRKDEKTKIKKYITGEIQEI